MDNTEKTLIAFLAGAAAGALTGLLLAPDSGEKTRKKLGKNIDTWKDELETTWDKTALKISDLTDSVLEDLDGYSKKVADNIKN
ncbi:YtxH domain-containing protein [Roseivirga sp. BDSF3-8]|uniref:YtxH domain-containing protein n=1 Tax=Roseivirga sp. BDSF3-8 TaxID=3241598 RepID=UPI0035322B9A